MDEYPVVCPVTVWRYGATSMEVHRMPWPSGTAPIGLNFVNVMIEERN